MISKQFDLPLYICNPVGGALSLFKSPVARTNKANLAQEEFESFQAPSAVLVWVDSQQVTFRLHSWIEELFIISWDLVEGWVIIVSLDQVQMTAPFANKEQSRGANA